jgi:hypothetical protein
MIFKMKVEDKTYGIKIAIKKFISYFLSFFLIL